jgi:hypothetical protein
LKARIVWTLVAVGVIGAALAIVLLSLPEERQNSPDAISPPAASGRPSGDVINRITGEAVRMLSQCLQGRPLPQCRGKPMVGFVFSVEQRAGMVLGMTLDRGWLDPDLFQCWKEQVAGVRVEAPGQAGKVNVQYPLACDQQGKIHIRPPVWGGSLPKKKIPPP